MDHSSAITCILKVYSSNPSPFPQISYNSRVTLFSPSPLPFPGPKNLLNISYTGYILFCYILAILTLSKVYTSICSFTKAVKCRKLIQYS